MEELSMISTHYRGGIQPNGASEHHPDLFYFKFVYRGFDTEFAVRLKVGKCKPRCFAKQFRRMTRAVDKVIRNENLSPKEDGFYVDYFLNVHTV